ncbi:unnamed protein product [Danaus chrysippus]|uniref:Paramyosin n=1 Tax=Danaus chrysippus TaxID=151541 RepID=A0A8J2MX82_9NEOP|nr:unnamed protein product [Danaus chrysippus]
MFVNIRTVNVSGKGLIKRIDEFIVKFSSDSKWMLPGHVRNPSGSNDIVWYDRIATFAARQLSGGRVYKRPRGGCAGVVTRSASSSLPAALDLRTKAIAGQLGGKGGYSTVRREGREWLVRLGLALPLSLVERCPTVAKTSKYTYRSSGGGSTDVNIEYSADLSALSRLEDKIRLLHDDLESERELRQRIEREKADLSVQVIQLSERLEEAEGGAESQFEINRKRDTELTKLRKLLEDVHLESEETAHLLKKKHQEIVVDFQEQIDKLTHSKARSEKEKAKFQAEVYELLAQVENISKEKIVISKTCEKLEITISELNIKIEELNRTIVDITSHKQRLSQENIELVKEVQDLKVNIENVVYLKSQLASQLEDARRKLEDDERRRSLLEANLHQVEIDLESVRVQLEEESEARLDLERQLVKSNGEVMHWRSKFEAEAAARAEEIEEIRRKYSIRIQEQEEQIETLIAKINSVEKQKSRLQSEVEVLIIDLEKANGTARELQKRTEQLERVNIEIKSRLEETVQLYEQSQRDLRNKQVEIQRISHELDKTREQKDALGRENKKLGDDLHDARANVTELTRRLHELEIELRRLENEREELTAAYKEAEAGRKAEEQRAQRLAAELGQFRHDAERRIQEKEEEIESIRYEIVQLFILTHCV